MDKISSRQYLSDLIDRYQNLIFSICYKMTQDYFAAQDLTQDTFLSAYEHADDFDGENEKAWICRIASNKCVDYLRLAQHRQVPTEDSEMESYRSKIGRPEEEALERDVTERLVENCKKLKPPYDEIAYLYFYQEKKPEEIAKLQNRKLKTIQTQIYRARDMMRSLYQNEKNG